MRTCPPWCRSSHQPAPGPDSQPIHTTTPAHVGGVVVTVEAAGDRAPEVHVCGDGDLTADTARQLAAVILAAADRLDTIST